MAGGPGRGPLGERLQEGGRGRGAAVLTDDPYWYKDAVVYEVHVRSFKDSNGDGVGDFPGLIEGQRLVARDEARHIGIGVSYARRRMNENREEAVEAITEVLDDFASLAARGLEIGKAELEGILSDGYGVDADAFHAEAMRLLQIRLKSIGYLDDA